MGNPLGRKGLKRAQGKRTEVKSACQGIRHESSKKRKAPEEKTEGEVRANGCWCGLFVIAVCLFLVCAWRSLQGQGKN